MKLPSKKVQTLLTLAIKKAKQSICKYKVSAIGFNKHGDVIAVACNKPRFMKYGGGWHAEMILMKKFKSSLKSIVLCRASKNGNLRPMHPCQTCKKVADQNNITIYTLSNVIEKLR